MTSATQHNQDLDHPQQYRLHLRNPSLNRKKKQKKAKKNRQQHTCLCDNAADFPRRFELGKRDMTGVRLRPAETVPSEGGSSPVPAAVKWVFEVGHYSCEMTPCYRKTALPSCGSRPDARDFSRKGRLCHTTPLFADTCLNRNQTKPSTPLHATTPGIDVGKTSKNCNRQRGALHLKERGGWQEWVGWALGGNILPKKNQNVCIFRTTILADQGAGPAHPPFLS